jgi:heat shock protein HslJ
VGLLLAGLILVTGCIDPTTDEPPTGGSETISPLTDETLKNAVYHGIYAEAIQLTDGLYEGEPFVEGGASRPTVTFTGAYAFGDLNANGVTDVVVVLVESSGGSGNFRYLAVVLNQEGKPENVATALLGDRAQVQTVTVDGADITVNAVAHGPDDPMCCPTQKVTLTYRFDGEQLIKVSEETDAAQAPVVLEGTRWTLVSYLNSQGETVYVLPGTEITAEFSADRIAGIAGCNNYFASYQIEKSGISFGPVGATEMWCAEPEEIMVQEHDYLTALEAAGAYLVEGDTLALMDAKGNPVATFTQTGGSDIVGTVWKWERFDDTAGVNDIIVDDPTQYTLALLPDGTYQVGADCNRASGGYTLEGNSLTLLPGPTTLAECEPGSLYDAYLTRLGDVVTFVLDEEKLVLNLKADAGNMVFVRGTDGETEATTPSPVSPDQIVDITWQWAELIETEPASQSLVADPENYTLVFRSDGTYALKADCNVGSGAYTLEGNNLKLEPGPMTLAECGPESLFDLYLTTLGNVDSLSVEDGRLVLHLRGNAGNMVFRNAGLASETQGETAASDIAGRVWMWQETITPVDVTSVDNPEEYTIELLPDGQFRVSADCNSGSGNYTLGDSHVSFEFGPMTLAECAPASLSDQFIKDLSAAVIYFLEGDELFIDLKYDSGTMRFAPGD